MSYFAELSVEECILPTGALDNFAKCRNSYRKIKFFFNLHRAK